MSQNKNFDDIESELIDPVRSNGRFRLANSRVHLTYKGWFDKEKYLDYMGKHIIQRYPTTKIEVYSIVQEVGDKTTNYEHTHVAFKFNNGPQITDARFFDYSENLYDAQTHPNIKAVKTDIHWNTICGQYHKKTGNPVLTNYVPKTISHAKPELPDLDELRKCNSPSEVVELLASKSKDLIPKTGPYLKAWEAIKTYSETIDPPIEEFRIWQKELIDEIIKLGHIDDRVIIWYFDKLGGAGKTKLANMLVEHHNGCIITTGNVKDAFFAIESHIKKNNKSPTIIIFNITRALSEYSGIYTIIESLKDKMFTSGKYSSKTIKLDTNPTVLVMSNSEPDISKLSHDRWWIRIIDRNGRNIDHNFVGSSAKALMDRNRTIEECKTRIAKEEESSYKSLINSGQFYDIELYGEISKLLQEIDMLYDEYIIGTIIYEYKPITPQQFKSGRIEERHLTEQELQTGRIGIVKINQRVMTPEEKSNVDETKARNKKIKEEELANWAKKQRPFIEEDFRKEIRKLMIPNQ